jgi:hypothetical protein
LFFCGADHNWLLLHIFSHAVLADHDQMLPDHVVLITIGPRNFPVYASYFFFEHGAKGIEASYIPSGGCTKYYKGPHEIEK